MTALGASGKEDDARSPAELIDVSSKGARLRIGYAVPVGAAVRIDTGDHVVLGEVCHCSPFAEGYVCGIEIDQVLSYVTDLNRLMEAIAGVPHGSRIEESAKVRARR